jgi:hypothetical protein
MSRRPLLFRLMVPVGKRRCGDGAWKWGVIEQACFQVASLYLQLPKSVPLQSVLLHSPSSSCWSVVIYERLFDIQDIMLGSFNPSSSPFRDSKIRAPLVKLVYSQGRRKVYRLWSQAPSNLVDGTMKDANSATCSCRNVWTRQHRISHRKNKTEECLHISPKITQVWSFRY